jgi:hypothetical protein
MKEQIDNPPQALINSLFEIIDFDPYLKKIEPDYSLDPAESYYWQKVEENSKLIQKILYGSQLIMQVPSTENKKFSEFLSDVRQLAGLAYCSLKHPHNNTINSLADCHNRLVLGIQTSSWIKKIVHYKTFKEIGKIYHQFNLAIQLFKKQQCEEQQCKDQQELLVEDEKKNSAQQNSFFHKSWLPDQHKKSYQVSASYCQYHYSYHLLNILQTSLMRIQRVLNARSYFYKRREYLLMRAIQSLKWLSEGLRLASCHPLIEKEQIEPLGESCQRVWLALMIRCSEEACLVKEIKSQVKWRLQAAILNEGLFFINHPQTYNDIEILESASQKLTTKSDSLALLLTSQIFLLVHQAWLHKIELDRIRIERILQTLECLNLDQFNKSMLSKINNLSLDMKLLFNHDERVKPLHIASILREFLKFHPLISNEQMIQMSVKVLERLIDLYSGASFGSVLI